MSYGKTNPQGLSKSVLLKCRPASPQQPTLLWGANKLFLVPSSSAVHGENRTLIYGCWQFACSHTFRGRFLSTHAICMYRSGHKKGLCNCTAAEWTFKRYIPANQPRDACFLCTKPAALRRMGYSRAAETFARRQREAPGIIQIDCWRHPRNARAFAQFFAFASHHTVLTHHRNTALNLTATTALHCMWHRSTTRRQYIAVLAQLRSHVALALSLGMHRLVAGTTTGKSAPHWLLRAS